MAKEKAFKSNYTLRYDVPNMNVPRHWFHVCIVFFEYQPYWLTNLDEKFENNPRLARAWNDILECIPRVFLPWSN